MCLCLLLEFVTSVTPIHLIIPKTFLGYGKMIEKTHKLMTDLSAFNSKSKNLILKRLSLFVTSDGGYFQTRISNSQKRFPRFSPFQWLGSTCTPTQISSDRITIFIIFDDTEGYSGYFLSFFVVWAFLFNTKSFNNVPFLQMVSELLCLCLPQMDAKRPVYHLHRRSKENQSANFHTINTAFESVADSEKQQPT